MKKIETEDFFESTFFLFLVKFLSFLPLLMVPLLANSVEKYIFAQAMLALTIERFLFIIYEYGLHLPNIKRITELKSDKLYHHNISEIYTEICCIRSLIWFLVVLLFYFTCFIFEIEAINLTFILICFIAGYFRALSPLWVYQAIKKLKFQFYMALVSKLLCFLIVLYLYLNSYLSAINYLGILVLGEFLSTFFGVLIFKLYGFFLLVPRSQNVIQKFKEATVFFFGRISSAGYNSIPAIALGIYNPISFAIYAVGERLLIAMQSINSPIMDSLFAHRISDNFKKFKNAFMIFCILIFIISTLAFILSEFIILTLFGDSFSDSIFVFQILAIAYFFQSISSMIGHPLLTIKGFGYVTNLSVVIGFIASILILLYLFNNSVLSGKNIATLLLLVELIVLTVRLIFIAYNKNIIFHENKS
tara:strand:- start:15854 stop:17107 length:1254 start_codon:yes stop_codon:yes gene_type:complete